MWPWTLHRMSSLEETSLATLLASPMRAVVTLLSSSLTAQALNCGPFKLELRCLRLLVDWRLTHQTTSLCVVRERCIPETPLLHLMGILSMVAQTFSSSS